MFDDDGNYLSPKEVKKKKSKGTTQKTIIMGNGLWYEIRAMHHRLASHDVSRGITLHKFMIMLLQDGLQQYKKSYRVATKGGANVSK